MKGIGTKLNAIITSLIMLLSISSNITTINVYAEEIKEIKSSYDVRDFAEIPEILSSSDDEVLQEQNVEIVEPQSLKASDFGIDKKYILTGNKNDIKDMDSIFIKDKNGKKRDEIKDTSKVDTLMSAAAMSTEYEPDSYETNDDFDEAYPYSNCIKMTGNAFVEGYVSAGIHNDTDNDVFSINLSNSKEYFFHLKNLSADYDMYLVNPTKDAYWALPQWGNTEEYFYLTPPTSGTYYIVILGNGIPSYSHYFLYAGESVITKTLSESTGLTFNFNGAGTIGYLQYSTIGKIPSSAVLNSVSIDSNGSGYWVGLTKYLKSQSGKVYSNQEGTGLNYINYNPLSTGYEAAAQNWSIAGKCYNGTSYFTWRPNITMTYTYVMKP